GRALGGAGVPRDAAGDRAGVQLGGGRRGPRRRGRNLGARVLVDASHRPAARGGAGAAMTAPGFSGVGALVGLLGGLGLLLVISRVRARRATLDQRLAPALRPRDATSGLLREQPVHTPFPV